MLEKLGIYVDADSKMAQSLSFDDIFLTHAVFQWQVTDFCPVNSQNQT